MSVIQSKGGRDFGAFIEFLGDSKALSAEYKKLSATESDVNAGFRKLEAERKQLKIDLAGLKALEAVAQESADKIRSQAHEVLLKAVKFKNQEEAAANGRGADLNDRAADIAAQEIDVAERSRVAEQKYKVAEDLHSDARKMLVRAKKLEDRYKNAIAGLKGEL